MRAPASIKIWIDQQGKNSVLIVSDLIAVDSDEVGQLWPTIQLNGSTYRPGLGGGGLVGDIRIEIRVPDMRSPTTKTFEHFLDQEIGL